MSIEMSASAPPSIRMSDRIGLARRRGPQRHADLDEPTGERERRAVRHRDERLRAEPGLGVGGAGLDRDARARRHAPCGSVFHVIVPHTVPAAPPSCVTVHVPCGAVLLSSWAPVMSL